MSSFLSAETAYLSPPSYSTQKAIDITGQGYLCEKGECPLFATTEFITREDSDDDGGMFCDVHSEEFLEEHK